MDKGEKLKRPFIGLAGMSEKRGKPFNPTRPTEDARKEISPPRAIPIGIPVSREEYEKLKEAAKRGKPSSTEGAQEDPSTTKDHD